MIAAIGFGCVVIGTALACSGPLSPRYTSAIETAGGIFVVGGLVIIGSQLTFFRL